MCKPTNRTCDVPGCFTPRVPNQCLCTRCWSRLPAEIRIGIREAAHQRRWSHWNQLRDRAAGFLNLGRRPAPAMPVRTITPQRAFEMQAQLLGERIDA